MSDPRSSRPALFGSLSSRQGEIVRYVLVSGFSFCWILGSSALMVEVIGIGQRLAVALALFSALAINFTLLRIFVFPGQSVSLRAQFAATAVVSLAFRGAEWLLFLLLVDVAGLNYLVATGLSVTCSAIGKFLAYRNVVFRHRGDVAV